MRSLSFRLLHEMIQSKTQNIFLSPIWVLKSGTVCELERYFVKVFFFANEDRIDLKKLHFKLTYNEMELDVSSDSFVRAETYPNDKVFGCLIPLPEDYKGSDYTILLTGITIGDKFFDYTSFERGDVYYDVYVPNVKKKFLKSIIPYYLQFPRMGETYWQCTCGQHNPKHAKNCYECFKEQETINHLIEDGFDVTFIKYYVYHEPLEYDPMMSFDNSYDAYVEKISRIYDIDLNVVKENVKYDVLKETYPNIIEDYNRRVKEKKELFFKETKHNIIRFSMYFLSIILLLSIAMFGPKSLNYVSGYYNLLEKDYSNSLMYFSRSKNFLNTDTLINEVYYQWAESVSYTEIEKAIEILEYIPNMDYQNAKVLYKEYIDTHGKSLFDQQKYEDAIFYLSKVHTNFELLNESKYLYLNSSSFSYDDTVKMDLLKDLANQNYKDTLQIYNQINYEYALKSIENNQYKDAILALENIVEYKDSSQLLSELSYDYALKLIEEDQLELSLNYINHITDTRLGKELYNEVEYRLAQKFENNNQYSEALLKYRLIKDYKNSSKKINELEKIVSPWTVEVSFSDQDTVDSKLTKISKDQSIYINVKFETTNSELLLNPMIIITFPNGEVDKYDPEEIISPSEIFSFYYEDGLYVDASIGENGIFKIDVYDKNYDIYLGSGEIEIID